MLAHSDVSRSSTSKKKPAPSFEGKYVFVQWNQKALTLLKEDNAKRGGSLERTKRIAASLRDIGPTNYGVGTGSTPTPSVEPSPAPTMNPNRVPEPGLLPELILTSHMPNRFNPTIPSHTLRRIALQRCAFSKK